MQLVQQLGPSSRMSPWPLPPNFGNRLVRSMSNPSRIRFCRRQVEELIVAGICFPNGKLKPGMIRIETIGHRVEPQRGELIGLRLDFPVILALFYADPGIVAMHKSAYPPMV